MKIKKALIFFITLAIGLAVFSLMSGEVQWDDVWKSLSIIRWWQALILFLLMASSMIFTTLCWKTILGKKKDSISFLNLLKIYTVGFTLGYLTPISLIGGEALEAYLLHQKLKISWKKSIVSIIIQEIIDFLILVMVLTIGLGAFFFLGGRLSKKLGLLMVIILFAIFLFFFSILTKSSKHRSLIGGLIRLIGLEQILETEQMKTVLNYEQEGLRFFNSRRHDFWRATGFTALAYLFYFFQSFFLVYLLSGHWMLVGGLIVQAFSTLGSLMLLPASLGSLEMMEGFAFQALGLSLGLALTFSLLWRGIRLVVCFFGGVIFLWLTRNLAREKLKKVQDLYLYGKSKDS